jgi:hypothetical protein
MPFDLKTPEVITVIGWGVTFVLGVLATILAQRLTKQRKRISWSLVNESSLLSEESLQEISEGFHVPLKILVNGNEETNLSTLRVKVANTGNIEVENVQLHFSFGENAVAHVGRYLGNLGVYRQSLHLEKNRNVATLDIAHINNGQSFEVEFLVAGYRPGDFCVDMAAPGVTLKQTDQLSLEVGIGRATGHAVSVGLFGVKYEPTATQTSLLVSEVRELRKVLERAIKRR